LFTVSYRERNAAVVVSSGIVLPGKEPLTLREVTGGLYIAVNAYECDAGYFGQSPLYSMEQPASPPESQAEKAKPPATLAVQ
jgi:hypothetical protein